MNWPRILMLVHGGRESIELVRAKGLARGYPADRVHFLMRDGARGKAAQEWHRQIKALSPDLIYVINTALPGLFTARWWRQVHGVPYIIDTGDLVHEMARSAGLYPTWKLPLLKLLEEQTLKHARTIVVRGSEHQAHLRARGFPQVQLIRDGVDVVPPPEAGAVQALKARLGLEGKFVVGVMGSLVYSPRLQICYGWDLVQALAALKDLPVQGVVIGDGPGRAWLEEQARVHGVAERVTFCGRIPHAEVPLYLRTVDVALSTQTNNLAGRVRTTGKLPEYMAAERFVIASRVGDAEQLLPPEMLLDYAGEVDAAYPQRLAARVRELILQPARLALRHTLPPIARAHCAYDVLSQKFNSVVQGGC